MPRAFKEITDSNLAHIPRGHNEEANRLAKIACGYREDQEILALSEVQMVDDWRSEIANYLKNPSQRVSRKLRYKALKFVVLDDQLYYKSIDVILLKCLNQEDARKIIYEVHEGLCGAHQSAYRMKWIITRTGHFWPTMLEDCFEYYKGCQNFQRFGIIQRAPASGMNPIIKPWPFRG